MENVAFNAKYGKSNTYQHKQHSHTHAKHSHTTTSNRLPSVMYWYLDHLKHCCVLIGIHIVCISMNVKAAYKKWCRIVWTTANIQWIKRNKRNKQNVHYPVRMTWQFVQCSLYMRNAINGICICHSVIVFSLSPLFIYRRSFFKFRTERQRKIIETRFVMLSDECRKTWLTDND